MFTLMRRKQGFSLIEMLLVMVIISVLIVMGLNYTTQKTDELRRDRASLQYQQIMNAALAYYVNTSATAWPSIATLMANNYLPNITLNNPWGYPYSAYTVGNIYYVYSQMPSNTNAQLTQALVVAGRLPMGFLTTDTSPPNPGAACTASSACYLAAGVTIPGQNLNNARSVNFMNIYHHGGCVPAPVCPGNMTADIMVVPVSVSGINSTGSPPTTAYPIASFSAYAVGCAVGSSSSTPCTFSNVGDCTTPTTVRICLSSGITPMPPNNQNLYWRVCLKVMTSIGDVASSNPTWGDYVSVLAITRCSPNGENVGSDFTVYSP